MAVGFGAPLQLRCGSDVVGRLDLVTGSVWLRHDVAGRSHTYSCMQLGDSRCATLVGKGNSFVELQSVVFLTFQNIEPGKRVNMCQ